VRKPLARMKSEGDQKRCENKLRIEEVLSIVANGRSWGGSHEASCLPEAHSLRKISLAIFFTDWQVA
jgi:hypothetical protein